MTLFLDHPWVKHVAESSYMVELLRFLRIGRKLPSILSKFSDLPEEYVLGALEALESLGVLRSLDISGEKFYVLTNEGKLLLSYIEELRKPSV
ncbi:MAG: hypothetical protein GXO00_03260 [Candidatus Diapherotrites archaeon]|nr:hypothetical protein [Candidatus Diapherotrites archaeon]